MEIRGGGKLKPEMEITGIILAKISRLCQLSSHSRGSLSRLWIFWISWGGGGWDGRLFTFFNFGHILLVALFLVRFLIYLGMKQIQTTKNPWKNPKSPHKKIREPNGLKLLSNVCDFQKENHTLEYGFLHKI